MIEITTEWLQEVLSRSAARRETDEGLSRTYWYEGDDPTAFIKEMQANYPGVKIYIDSVSIRCPMQLEEAIYWSRKYPLGS